MSLDLDTIREHLKASAFSLDNVHHLTCGCAECSVLWRSAMPAAMSRDALVEDVPLLIGEVEKLRHLLARKTTACDEWITIANERRLEPETLGKKGLGPLRNPRFDIESVRKKAAEAWADGDRHYAGDLNDLERCLKELEQTTHERATLYNYVLTLEEGALEMEDRIRERQ